jgi:hypothetical protein
VGEVIALAQYARARRARRARTSRALHEACRVILARTVDATRFAAAAAPPEEQAMWARRLRKLEALETYAAAIG